MSKLRVLILVVFISRVSDPDSIRSVDPDPYSESGSREAKMTHKSRKKFEIS